MNDQVEYVSVIVVVPSGSEYDVEINPLLDDASLLQELVSYPDLNLSPPASNYKLRAVHRNNQRIRENSVIVIDDAKRGNIGGVSKRF
jgi:hypothetical protein